MENRNYAIDFQDFLRTTFGKPRSGSLIRIEVPEWGRIILEVMDRKKTGHANSYRLKLDIFKYAMDRPMAQALVTGDGDGVLMLIAIVRKHHQELLIEQRARQDKARMEEKARREEERAKQRAVRYGDIIRY